jgi:DNA-binding NarL/FixJ family response regulator
MDEMSSAIESLAVRVLVVGRTALERAGLRTLAAEAGIAVVGQAGSVEDAEADAVRLMPDAVLAAWNAGAAEEIARLIAALDPSGIPVILIGTVPEPGVLARLIHAGLRGFLLPDASGEDIGTAVAAASRGLLVLDPILGRAFPTVPLPVASPGPEAEALTEREREVLQLIALGLPNKAIARHLGVSEHTVKFHVGAILAKLGAASRTEAVTRAARQGLLAL